MSQRTTLDEWRENAEYWTRFAPVIHQMFAPLTRALIEELQIKKGDRVLDIAGGAGEPAFSIASQTGENGSVTCTDAVAEMLTAARRLASESGIANIEFQNCTAESLPFADDTFNAVESRLGIMFFSDPPKALREMLRVAKPGGRIALAVWHKAEFNPFCGLPSKVMAQHIPSDPAGPDAPTAYRFAEEGKLARLLAEAGAVSVKERLFEFRITGDLSFSDYWNLRATTSGTLRDQLKTLPADEVELIATEVADAVAPFFPNDRMDFPAAMVLVSGRKSGTP
ncbi:MAG TPA: class I SAM-dependent methyltransferase [Pyrinomonadaceae bacterium]